MSKRRRWYWPFGEAPATAPARGSTGKSGPGRLKESRNPFSGTDAQDYRTIAGVTSFRDLSSAKHRSHLDTVYRLYMMNPLAKRIIDIQVDFIIGNGITFDIDQEKKPDLYRVVNAHWTDWHNRWDTKQENKCRELQLYGEQCYQPFVNEHTGHVRLGYLDPALITDVEMNASNPELPGAIVLGTADSEKRMSIITEGPDGMLTGQVLFFKENSVSNANRGYSDLLYAVDWLYSFDEAVFDVLDNLSFANLFMWDIEIKGASEPELAKRLLEIQNDPPRAGSFNVHSENETWNSKTPSVTSIPDLEALKMIRTMIIGGAGQPEHWHGAGGDVNRAVGSVMGIPSYRMMQRKQKHFLTLIQDVLRYQVEQAKMHDERLKIDLDTDRIINLHGPKIEEENFEIATQVLQTMTDSLLVAVEEKWLTKDTARRVYVAALQKFDVSIDMAEETEALRQKAEDVTENMTKLIKEFRRASIG